MVFCITFLHFVSDLPPVVLQIQSQTKKVLINLMLTTQVLLDTKKKKENSNDLTKSSGVKEGNHKSTKLINFDMATMLIV